MPQQGNMSRPHYTPKKDNSLMKLQPNPVVVSQQQDHHGAYSKNHSNYLNNSSSSGDSSTNSTTQPRNSNGSSFNQRQRGTVEKLLHSYGFIDSEAQKDGHLFFHYSEVVSDVNALILGDKVEFNLSYDYRSSRWLAVSVTRVVSDLTVTISKELFTGQILQKAEHQEKFKNSLDRSGRIQYEQSGEVFYIPYSTLDLDDKDDPAPSPPNKEDEVHFWIATDKKTGHMWATAVKTLQPTPMSEGVVCSLKENFGFIERADMVKEIFFHYSEYSGNIAELVLGDDVEFSIQTRNNKEVATNITKLPEGTVIFEDVSTEKRRGKIAKVIKATRKHAEPLAGQIIYETVEESKNIPYSERDINGEFTLFVGDIVDFQVAKDRRDGLLHATNVMLCEESFTVSKEKRDKGVVSSVKESYGFLQILRAPDCSTGMGDAQLFFHFNELYESTNSPVVVGDEIEFTVAFDPNNKSKPIAIRIRKLPKGSIKQDQVVSSQTYNGIVVQDQPAKGKKSPPGVNGPETGLIKYTVNGKEANIIYLVKDADLRYGDKVSFNVCETKRSSDPSTKKAANIKLLSRLGVQAGFICGLKDSYGFIETVPLDDEIFFHYSCYVGGDAFEVEIGDPVEYNLVCRNKKVSAENVKKSGNKKLNLEVKPKLVSGTVIRAIRSSATPEREDYGGLIQTDNQDDERIYPFGIVSLLSKRSYPVLGAQVEFQVASVSGSIDRAVNVISVKDVVLGCVDSIKGSYGFIEVEDREKKIHFNLSDVQDSSTLSVGDGVQFLIMPVFGSSKISAVCVRKLSSKQQTARPERLISKLKTQMSMAEGPKLIVIRQPQRPDGKTKGFAPRTCPPNPCKREVTA